MYKVFSKTQYRFVRCLLGRRADNLDFIGLKACHGWKRFQKSGFSFPFEYEDQKFQMAKRVGGGSLPFVAKD